MQYCKEEIRWYTILGRDQTIYIFASSVDLQANSLKFICRLTAMNM